MKEFMYKWILRPYFNLYVKKIVGLQNIDPKSNYLFISNHNSGVVDGIGLINIIFNHTGKFLNPVTKFHPIHSTKKSRVIKNLLERFGNFFVDYLNAWDKNVINKAVNKLNNGTSILIFPEGGANVAKVLKKGRTGAARMALMSKAKVVPLGIKDTDKIIPLRAYLPRFHRATFIFGKPFTLDEFYGRENEPEVLREVTSFIMKKISKLCGKPYPFLDNRDEIENQVTKHKTA